MANEWLPRMAVYGTGGTVTWSDGYLTTSNSSTTTAVTYKDVIRGIEEVNRKFKYYKYTTNACTSSEIWRNWEGTTSCTVSDEFYGTSYYKCYGYDRYEAPPVPASHRLREIIAQRHAPLIIATRKALIVSDDIREQRARETLRRVIGDDKYFNFLKSGFVSVRANSGLIYQIFPGHGITCVFDKGIMVERLCVVLQGNFPATDSVIMRYLLILNNEDQFRKFAIKHSVMDRKKERERTLQLNQQKSRLDETLADIYKSLKKAS
jgi:hypothetical protein